MLSLKSGVLWWSELPEILGLWCCSLILLPFLIIQPSWPISEIQFEITFHLKSDSQFKLKQLARRCLQAYMIKLLICDMWFLMSSLAINADYVYILFNFFPHCLLCGYVQVFQNAQELLQGYQVHPEIQAQMFAYLFFFSNVSLFNQLMDKGRTKKIMPTHTFSSIRTPSGYVEVCVCILVSLSAFWQWLTQICPQCPCLACILFPSVLLRLFLLLAFFPSGHWGWDKADRKELDWRDGGEEVEEGRGGKGTVKGKG